MITVFLFLFLNNLLLLLFSVFFEQTRHIVSECDVKIYKYIYIYLIDIYISIRRATKKGLDNSDMQ